MPGFLFLFCFFSKYIKLNRLGVLVLLFTAVPTFVKFIPSGKYTVVITVDNTLFTVMPLKGPDGKKYRKGASCSGSP